MNKRSKFDIKKYILGSIIMAIVFYIVHRTFGETNYYAFVFGCFVGVLDAIVLFDD